MQVRASKSEIFVADVCFILQHNFEAERDALMAGLSGTNAKFASERERQAELARLKREQRRARQEDNFESAALMLTLAKTQQAALEGKYVCRL